MKKALIKIWKRALALFPTKVPVGVTEFNTWVESIKETYDLATKDEDSIRFALAAAILNLGTTGAYKPKHYFYLLIQAGAAKQVAGSVFHEIKMKQRAAEEDARKAASANS